MDTGKILMGTALILLMIGLVIHPVSAEKTSNRFPAVQETVTTLSGQILTGSDLSCATGPGSSVPAMQPCEQQTAARIFGVLPVDEGGDRMSPP